MGFCFVEVSMPPRKRTISSRMDDMEAHFQNMMDLFKNTMNNKGAQAGANKKIPHLLQMYLLEWNAAYHQGWADFQRSNPEPLWGYYDPEKADQWLHDMEEIFDVLRCDDAQKVSYVVYKIKGEAKYWWRGTKHILESQGQQITWQTFQGAFLDKYFPLNVRREKEVEFLQLKQRNMTFEEYLATFERLSKFSIYL